MYFFVLFSRLKKDIWSASEENKEWNFEIEIKILTIHVSDDNSTSIGNGFCGLYSSIECSSRT